jgi:hypothetical protein
MMMMINNIREKQHTITSILSLPQVGEIERFIQEENIDMSGPSTVYVGRDTRPSSPELALAAVEGISAVGGQAVFLGVVTTPQLHYVVRCCAKPEYGVRKAESLDSFRN